MKKLKTLLLILGIDLGTTRTAFTIFDRDGKILALKNAAGNYTTPSVVAFADGQILVGEGAERAEVMYPNDTIRQAKRSLDTLDAIYVDESTGREYTAVDISAEILKAGIKQAEKVQGGKILRAVVTVPAYSSAQQKLNTKAAAKAAGLEVVELEFEPVAAALQYVEQGRFAQGNLMVFDFGGGTFDLSILEVDGNNLKTAEISGDRNLGGEDLTSRIAAYVQGQLRQCGADLNDEHLLILIRDQSEAMKLQLSSAEKAEASFFLPSGRQVVELSRTDYHKLICDELDRLRTAAKKAIDAFGKTIDQVLFVGGSSRAPIVQELVAELLPDAEQHLDKDPDLAVSHGAAISAGRVFKDTLPRMGITGDDLELTKITPFSIGVETIDMDAHDAGKPLDECRLFSSVIAKSTDLPADATEVFSLVQKNQRQVRVKVASRLGDEPWEQLAEMDICDLPPGPSEDRIEISFVISEDGLVKASAKDLYSGKQAAIDFNWNGCTGSSDDLVA